MIDIVSGGGWEIYVETVGEGVETFPKGLKYFREDSFFERMIKNIHIFHGISQGSMTVYLYPLQSNTISSCYLNIIKYSFTRNFTENAPQKHNGQFSGKYASMLPTILCTNTVFIIFIYELLKLIIFRNLLYTILAKYTEKAPN